MRKTGGFPFGQSGPTPLRKGLGRLRTGRFPGSFLRIGTLMALLMGTAPAQAETRELRADEMRQLASHNLSLKRPDLALPLAQALVRADPADFGAQLLMSYAARDLARYDEAEAAGKAAWKLASAPGQKHAAALAVAQAQASDNRRTPAQFWLRRAAQEAPTPAARARAIRDFNYVRARNPWSVHLNFGLAPSSNVNGGTNADTIWLYGLPFTLSGDAQALSGLAASASVTVERRISESRNHLTRLGMNVAGRTYRLSGEAKRLAPGARGSDYAFWAVEAYLSHRWRDQWLPGEWDARLTAGHNEYGGASLSNYLRADAGRIFDLGPDRALRLALSAEKQWRLDNDTNSAEIALASAEYRFRAGQGVTSLGLHGGAVRSEAVTVDHDRLGFSIGYRPLRPVLGAWLSFEAGYEQRRYGQGPFDSTGRTDDRITAGVSALLRQQSYMGFAPEIGVNYLRNRSSSVLNDSRDLGVSLRIRSTF